jgi:hypothetical protein
MSEVEYKKITNMNVFTFIKEIYASLKNINTKLNKMEDNMNNKIESMNNKISILQNKILDLDERILNMDNNIEKIFSVNNNVESEIESKLSNLIDNTTLSSIDKNANKSNIELELSEMTIANLEENNYNFADIQNTLLNSELEFNEDELSISNEIFNQEEKNINNTNINNTNNKKTNFNNKEEMLVNKLF